MNNYHQYVNVPRKWTWLVTMKQIQPQNLLDAQASQNYHTKEARRVITGDEAKFKSLKYHSDKKKSFLIKL